MFSYGSTAGNGHNGGREEPGRASGLLTITRRVTPLSDIDGHVYILTNGYPRVVGGDVALVATSCLIWIMGSASQ